MKVFRIIPEFRILRRTFHGKSNCEDNNNFSDLGSVYLKVFDHLVWNFKYFGGIQQVLNSDFLKFRILEMLNFHTCKQHVYLMI